MSETLSDIPDAPQITRHHIYSGRVQGVGFRYTVRELASHHPRVTGYVKNLPDGSVEMVAQGRLADIEALCHDIAERFRPNIRGFQPTLLTESETFSRFEIRY